ncbi:MAG TPA: hypothetical protein VFB35_00795 [Gaiellaceae bacterium]|nr:hypothetical protein [Gaiellaceae bacterium]
MQLKLHRSSPKRHRRKQALIAAGAVGVVAGTVKRFRRRRHGDLPEG